METSKRIILVSYIMMVSITLFSLGTFFLGYDVSGLSILLGLTWGEVTVANSFYFWKARAENKIKLCSTMPREQLELLKEVSHLFD